MKKNCFILLILSVFLILVSCGKDYYEITEKDKESAEKASLGEIEYVLNKSSGTYHLPDCYIVKNIKEENKVVTSDFDYLTRHQYSPCKKCIDK